MVAHQHYNRSWFYTRPDLYGSKSMDASHNITILIDAEV